MKQYLRRRYCRPCLALGGTLFLVSTVALAQAGGVSAGNAPLWWAMAVLSVAMLLAGAYMRGIENGIAENKKTAKEDLAKIETQLHARISRVEERATATDRSLLGDYHDKEALERALSQALIPMEQRMASLETNMSTRMQAVERQVSAVHRRLDYNGVPYSARSTGQQPSFPRIDEE